MPLSAKEIETLAGVGQRTLIRYAEAGIITRPKHRGPRTAYDDLDAARAIAMRDQLVQRVDYQVAKRIVRAMSPQELTTLLEARRAEVAAASRPPPAPKATPATTSSPTAAPTAGAAWRRISLLPGLELHLAEDASALVKNVAQEIAAMAARGPS